jgi:GR25 family glycosyltransferase involved in LPS biosynthesis
MYSYKDINNILYINLEHRKDRKIQIEQELNKMNWKGQRMSAIKNDIGGLGCSASHIQCLEIAISNKWNHVLICEDDISFLNPALLQHQLNGFLSNKEREWDVLLIAGNNYPPSEIIDNYSIKIKNCQTTSVYLVNGPYMKTLLDNFKEGYDLFTMFPEKHYFFAVDIYWKSLQKLHHWYLITPLTVIQSPGYSDVEKREVDYTNCMTNLKI